ncbi:MAG: glycosyltransferase, partial [Pseudomonadota bacterium]
AREKITISPNGVDLSLFGKLPEKDSGLSADLGLEDKTVLGFIGSFYDYEGIDDLIAAMPALLGACPDVHLLLVGGGPMEKQLKAQVADSAAASAISFVGRVPHEEVDRYYGLMDVMVYPRKSMRLTDLVTPLKPLEAMAQGRLVAASDVGGHKELIADGKTGLLFPAGNPEKIAEKLAELINSRSQWAQIIENGKKFVAADRNWSSNILRYNPVYQKLIASRTLVKAA